jgi:hypothetical protein
MVSYTVHLPDPRRRDAAVLEKAEFVPDAFSKGAFVFGGFWLLFHRLWIALALYVIALAVLIGVAAFLRLDPTISLWLSALANLLLGLEGNNLRRAALERSGKPAVDIVTARRLEEAEQKFFALCASRRAASPPGGASAPQRPAQTPVLGVFPEPGGRA